MLRGPPDAVDGAGLGEAEEVGQQGGAEGGEEAGRGEGVADTPDSRLKVVNSGGGGGNGSPTLMA